MHKLSIGSEIHFKLGQIWLAFSDLGLIALDFGPTEDEFLETVQNMCQSSAEINQEQTEPGRRQIREYLNGERKSFDLKIDWSHMTPFQVEVRKQAMQIPYGETRSYGELAGMAGRPRGARAVGQVMATNPIGIVIPCHRVLASDGSLHGYGGGLELKAWLLDLERQH